MKKWGIVCMLGLLAGACVNQKVVQYNTDRLDHIETYLQENKMVKPSETFETLKKEGTLEYSQEYKPLEKEAEAWVEKKAN